MDSTAFIEKCFRQSFKKLVRESISEGKLNQELKQVIHRNYSRLIDQRLQRIADNCMFHKELPNGVGSCDLDSTRLCMQGCTEICEKFQLRSKAEVKEEVMSYFREIIEQGGTLEYPDIAILLWLLDNKVEECPNAG